MITELYIKTALRKGKTILKTCFFTTPFKIANITENKNDHLLQLMLMTSSPGILDGDEYKIKIEIDEDCSLELKTQSYQRLFNMKKGASQNLEVFMEKNTSFCYLPHPCVPHKASDFAASNKIYLSDNCKLIWGEVFTCGRKLNGEEFQFSRYHNRTEIFVNNKLSVKENLLIKPSQINVKSIGQFEGFSHQASLIFIDASADVNKLMTAINDVLAIQENICAGISFLQINGIIVRLLGHKAEQLYNGLQKISEILSAKESCVSLTKP